MSEKQYRICTDCKIPHYENCDTCFGFGLKREIPNGPISAAEAMGGEPLPEWIECPECGSTPKGISANGETLHVVAGQESGYHI
jgi:hypothetical protein